MADMLSQDRIGRYNRLKSQRAVWDTQWDLIFGYMLPRKAFITSKRVGPSEDYYERIYDATAQDANEILAAGLVTNTTPPTERWAAFDAPQQLRAKNGGSPVVPDWFSQVSEITMDVISGSNFYSQAHEMHLERNAAGIAAIYVEEGKRSPLNFKAIPLGTYVFERDDEGMVDTFMWEFEISARQAVQKFGYENVGQKIRKAFDSKDDKDKKFCFLHSVYPREDGDRQLGRYDVDNMRYVSCYDAIEDKVEVERGGYTTFPYIVSRFNEWPGETWGWGPGLRALPIVRGANHIQKYYEKLAELQADPRVLIPSNMWGNVDFTPGGGTPVDESAGEFGQPREWATSGRAEAAENQIGRKQEEIRAAFHNDLFRMLAQMEPGRYTAYEIMRRENEKLEIFAPLFQRLTTEFLEPVMMRVFDILNRADYYPPIPQELLEVEGPSEEGKPVLKMYRPRVIFQSKMAQAIRRLENRSVMDLGEIIAPIMQYNSEVADNFDWDQAAPDIARNLGLPSRWIRSNEERDAIRQQRAQQQQQAMALEAAEKGSKAVANLAKVPPQ